LNPAEVAPLILNYLVAYQVLHRMAQVKANDKVLIIGASGGVGTAFLQLGKLENLTMYGLASPSKHAALIELGAIPIDYRSQDFVDVLRHAESSSARCCVQRHGRGLSQTRHGRAAARRHAGTLMARHRVFRAWCCFWPSSSGSPRARRQGHLSYGIASICGCSRKIGTNPFI
jgi:NADPH:quinone reductase-like Zn-dependent oxidoreductase